MNRPVDLHIGELVLDGLGEVSGPRVAAVAERHLAALVAQGGLPAVERHDGADRLVGAGMEVRPGAGAGEIGRAVATAVYRRLAR